MKAEPIVASAEKRNGRYYTPKFIVDNILDLSGYSGQAILKKHVIDNSCGDGAFLVSIVDRYCQEFLKNGSDLQTLSKELSTYIHGIDIDNFECRKCIENLNNTVTHFGLNHIDWDVICADTLSVEHYNGKMDYVLGNPPYVRVHNLGETYKNIKKFLFAQDGMADLYLVFYEIGLKMLNASGVLGYITPSSFFNSLAGKSLRFHLVNNNLIDKIVDLKHFQAFHATNYTTITILKNNREQKTTNYYRLEEKSNSPYLVDTLSVQDFLICNNFYFSSKASLDELKRILTFKPAKKHFAVKNGFATLADDFFIGNFEFDEYTIPVVKASTGKCYKCLFPYSEGKLIPYRELAAHSNIKKYFEANKVVLTKRSLDKNSAWYGFGRTQGIKDVYLCKYAINALVRTPFDIKLVKCDKGVGVYSGLYIITEIAENELREMLYDEDFITYISLLGKYKSGGYYTFSSKDLKSYLEYKYSLRNGFANE